jgi:hypothetical protein
LENEWKMKRRRKMEVRSYICSRTSRLITFRAWELIVMIAEGGVDKLEGLHTSAYL